MKKIKFYLSILVYSFIGLFTFTSHAAEPEVNRYPAYQRFADFLSQTHIDGNIRSYYFVRDFTAPDRPDQRAFSLGGKLNALTAPFATGFSIGATLYTAQPLGLNHSYDSGLADKSLPAVSITTLGQTYIQYKRSCFLARFGNQLVTTPWLNEADLRMIPATYQGSFISVNPALDDKAWTLQAMRLVRFKGRPVSTFSRSNLYNNSFEIGTPINQLLGTHDHGSLAVGVLYKDDTLNAQGWAYRFYDYVNLHYVEMNTTLSQKIFIFQPLVGAQFVHQSADGDNVIRAVGAGEVGTKAYGILVGSNIEKGQLTLGYNNITKKAGGFNNGGIVSPYTTNYISDPLYTSSMIAGLVEKAAGHAYKIAGLYYFFDAQLKLYLSYAKYDTLPFTPNTNETNIDITYLPSSLCKKLSLRYRLGILNGDPAFGRYDYHRVMFEYQFG